MSERSANPMLQLRVEKVTVNVCVGKSGEPLERAIEILRGLTGQKPAVRKAKKTIKGFGISKGEPIACIVTLRRRKAEEFLQRAFRAIGNRLPRSCFDRFGNFSFGIKEHIDLPGARYRPELGIIGMDVCVTIGRPGWRVAHRRRGRGKIGHRPTRDEAIEFIVGRYGVKVE